jgi:hypothetical protein
VCSLIHSLQAPLPAGHIWSVCKSNESGVAIWIFLTNLPPAFFTFSPISSQVQESQTSQLFFLTTNGLLNEKISLLLTQQFNELIYPLIAHPSATTINSLGISKSTYCCSFGSHCSFSSFFHTLNFLSSLFHSAHSLEGCGVFSVEVVSAQ